MRSPHKKQFEPGVKFLFSLGNPTLIFFCLGFAEMLSLFLRVDVAILSQSNFSSHGP